MIDPEVDIDDVIRDYETELRLLVLGAKLDYKKIHILIVDLKQMIEDNGLLFGE